MSEPKNFPASIIAHWATGPVHCCLKHANYLKNISTALGYHTHLEPYSGDEQCQNCLNEDKGK